jgi:hypothetical protein
VSRLAALAAILFACIATRAAATPLFFDFEDGVGEWVLSGSVRYEEAPVLGGEHALFGSDVGPLAGQIALEIDLTGISSLTLEQLWTSTPRPEANLVTVLVSWTDETGTPRFGRDRDGTSLLPLSDEPRVRDLRSFDLSGFTGPATVVIQWNEFLCPIAAGGDPDFFNPCFGSYFNGYIDDVRFHPVPEPSSALLLGLGVSVLAIRRRNPARGARTDGVS